jgi:fructose-specific phosphotransferase system IIA component
MTDTQFLDLACEEIVTLNLKAQDKVSAIEQLAELLYRSGKIRSKDEYIKDVLEREAHVATSVGRGVAIPHARSAAVIETAVAVGRTKGIHWADDDEEPVKLVFLLAVPAANPSSDYIGMLASLAGALLDDGFCQEMKDAANGSQVVECMRRYNVCARNVGGKAVQ